MNDGDRVFSPLVDVDFSTYGDQPGWPAPFQCDITYLNVSGSAGRGVTNPANHQNLPAYGATFPQPVQSVDSWGVFGIDGEPKGGEVTHGFAFITQDGLSSYFTELVHRPDTNPVVQCGQIMEPFPDFGPRCSRTRPCSARGPVGSSPRGTVCAIPWTSIR